ncbi:tetraacyldisaccharide 4'-kinase [Hylemonella gracilis]|jgi:tetraacyldisaccharide 4'-kinase|uniref:Tetraacyldisaccharide 4'-kinase n=1 Tax=Hylemonella gracilis TaxID=80880 RepID=A0A4P6ULQ9_9BURK|nr:tetraacyldisaccharide 4'-kinase [Hylemonella gracilis]QBK05120.1 tetraacyldisaccharide 4'-kinase [Hylemonella gracilis]
MRAPAFWQAPLPGQPRPWLGRCALLTLWPLSLLMRLLVRLRQGLYLSGMFKRHAAPVLVIVVGNVVAGGGGKTPTVIALVEHLRARGLKPGVISRGYGRRKSARGEDCREVRPDSPVDQVGDEPALIRRRTGVPVFVARQRIEAARALLAAHPEVNILVSDDGLQHLALARDIEVCVFGDRGLGNGLLLPAGPLREPWPRYVDLVLHTGQRPAFTGHAARRALASTGVDANGRGIALDKLQGPLVAVAGTAQPQAFFDMLRDRGLTLARVDALPDHADPSDYAHWHAELQQEFATNPVTVLCTEKDAFKLWTVCPGALAVPLVFELPQAFLDEFDRLLHAAFAAHLSSAYTH